jgi:hypothetical protein
MQSAIDCLSFCVWRETPEPCLDKAAKYATVAAMDRTTFGVSSARRSDDGCGVVALTEDVWRSEEGKDHG